MSQNIPIVIDPVKNIYGLGLSNNGTTPDEIVDIAVGQCRDSNDLLDIKVTAALSVNNTVNGANGLDSGSVAANTLYAVYVIASSQGRKAVAGLLSLASNATPTLPFEYDSYRKIGYVATDATSDFLAFYQYGNGADRVMRYDAPISALSAGAATAYTAVALTASVPPEENILVALNYSFTPNAASDTGNVTPGNATGDAFTVTGQVASVAISGPAFVMSKVTSAVPEVDYKVSVGTATLDLSVAGYNFSV